MNVSAAVERTDTSTVVCQDRKKAETRGIIEKVELPPLKSDVKIHKTSNEEPFNAVVSSHGGKVTGIHKNWLNVEYTSPETHAGLQDCIDFKPQIDHWEICEESGPQSTALIAFEDTSKNITGEFADAKQRTKILEWQWRFH